MTTKTLSVRAQLTEGIISGLFQPDFDSSNAGSVEL